MDPNGRKVARFGVFELDLTSHELRKQGLKIRLSEQPVQILLLLLERAGDTVTREELRQRLWSQDTFVDFDAGLNSAIKKLRDALGDPAENPRFIETLPRRGYRFIGQIQQPSLQPNPVAPRTEDVAPALLSPRADQTPARRPAKKWTVGVPLTALIVIVGWLIFVGLSDRSDRNGAGTNTTRIGSLAVLPCRNLTGDPAQQYFVDGMTETLTTNLAQFKSLIVQARTVVVEYTQRETPFAQIVQDLRLDAVVECAVMRSSDRVRLDARLIEASTGGILWANNFDDELRDLLRLQIKLADQIAAAIHIQVRPEERSRLDRLQAVKLDAYLEYLQGRFYWSAWNPDNLRRAEKHFLKAIQLDPSYAPAYSGLSDTYRLFDVRGVAAPLDSMPKAEKYARQAVTLDDSLAEAHASLAGVLFRYRWDWAGAEKEFDRALELDPNYAEGHRARAIVLLVVRRDDEAVSGLQRARELNRLSTVINIELANALKTAGHVQKAIEHLLATQKIAPPNSPQLRQSLALAYLALGDKSRALKTLEQDAESSRPWFGYLSALNGRREDALQALAALQSRSKREHISPQHFAVIHLGLQETEEALSLLEKAYAERSFELMGLSHIITDILIDNPQFRSLLERMDLAKQPGYAKLLAGRSPR